MIGFTTNFDLIESKIKLFDFFHTKSGLATSPGGIGSLFDLFSGENKDRKLQQVANTTVLDCDRVARVVRR